MQKVISNGQEVLPAKKVKLDKYMTRTEIRDMLLQKQKELKDVKQSSDNQEPT